MEKAVGYIDAELRSHCIEVDVRKDVARLVKAGQMTEDMAVGAAYGVFLRSKDHPVYKSLLHGQRPFDVRILFTKSKGSLEGIGERIDERIATQYTFVGPGFLGVKLRAGAYTYNSVAPCAVPFLKVFRAIRKNISFEDISFKDMVFPVEDCREAQKYTELVESLKAIDLPIKIVGDEFVNGKGTEGATEFHMCHLELEDRQWPAGMEAIRCAKTAFYCFIHKRSPHRYLVNKDFLMLKYKGSKFMVRINEPHDLLAELREVVQSKEDSWKENVRMIKKLLGHHGFYPLHFDDHIVDLLCLAINEHFPASFFDEFVCRKVDLNRTLVLDTAEFESSDGLFLRLGNRRLKLAVPESAILKRFGMLCKYFRNNTFKLFDRQFCVLTEKLLIPNTADFDLCFCRFKKAGFMHVPHKQRGMVASIEAKKLHSLGHFFYSVPLDLLMVKCKKDVDPKLLCCIVLMKMSFEYVKINE